MAILAHRPGLCISDLQFKVIESVLFKRTGPEGERERENIYIKKINRVYNNINYNNNTRTENQPLRH